MGMGRNACTIFRPYLFLEKVLLCELIYFPLFFTRLVYVPIAIAGGLKTRVQKVVLLFSSLGYFGSL